MTGERAEEMFIEDLIVESAHDSLAVAARFFRTGAISGA